MQDFSVNPFTPHECLNLKLGGGSVVEWSARRVRNAAVPGSSPTLTTSGFVLGRPEFKSSATLVNIQLVASCQLRFLILLCWI